MFWTSQKICCQILFKGGVVLGLKIHSPAIFMALDWLNVTGIPAKGDAYATLARVIFIKCGHKCFGLLKELHVKDQKQNK